MIYSTNKEKRIDDFDENRKEDIQRFIQYAQEQSKIWRKNAQEEIDQEARRYA